MLHAHQVIGGLLTEGRLTALQVGCLQAARRAGRRTIMQTDALRS